MPKRIITIHITDEALEQLDAWAERLDRSRNWLINEAIDVALADESIIERYHPEFNARPRNANNQKKAGAR